MVHACFLNKKQFRKLYGKLNNNHFDHCGLCRIDDLKIHDNCRFHRLFFLDQYCGRWEKLLYRISCRCNACKQM